MADFASCRAGCQQRSGKSGNWGLAGHGTSWVVLSYTEPAVNPCFKSTLLPSVPSTVMQFKIPLSNQLPDKVQWESWSCHGITDSPPVLVCLLLLKQAALSDSTRFWVFPSLKEVLPSPAHSQAGCRVNPWQTLPQLAAELC